MLHLRSIGPNDYSVLEDRREIGRIRYAKERTPGLWLWHVTVTLPGPPFGDAKSIGEAKDRFKAAWFAFKAEQATDDLKRAFDAMDYASRPGRYAR